MTTSKLHQNLIPEVRNMIAPEFRFLFRTDFYDKFFEEVVTKTLKAIEKENANNMTGFESNLMYNID